MKIEQVKLTQIKTNAENPRQIGKIKFQKLIDSIIVFPKMLKKRPPVVDGNMVALGGNMRLKALREIAKMDIEQIGCRLAMQPEYLSMTGGERVKTLEHWRGWLQSPTIDVVSADDLSESERRQFVIKDNASFGQWDYDALANKWDNIDLERWGVDVWTMPTTDFSASASSSTNNNPRPPQAMPDDSEIDQVSPNEFGDTFSLPEGERSPFQQMTFTFADSQSEFIRKTLKGIPDNEISEEDKSGNANGNGNRIYKIVKEWAEQRK